MPRTVSFDDALRAALRMREIFQRTPIILSAGAQRRRRRIWPLLLIAAILARPAAAADSPWGAVRTPSAGRMQAIGGPANGCIAGAAALPVDGPGFSVIRVSRNRFYGHRDTIAFIERLGLAAQAAGLAAFYVGDMAQARGGPL